LPDGTLQEAGCFIWQDGSCQGFARGRPSQYGPAMYQRKVDYCSGAFLMTRLSLFKEIGGFDARYIPAYYEETDYCVEIQKRGFDVVYDPRVAIDHFEFGSSHADSNAFNQMTINQVKFREKHQDFLSGKQPPKPSPSRALSSGHISKRRVLFIDDMVANVFIGAGYPRTNFIINYFHDMGWSISLYATQEIETKRWHEYYLDIPQTVEIMTGDIDLQSFLNEFISEYDLVWVSRPSNMKRFVEFMKGADCKLKPKVVYDSEAIFAERGLLESQIEGSQPSALYTLAYRDEIGNGSMADHIISVSERDAQIWHAKTQKPVTVVGHTVDLKPTSNSFTERKGFVFLGSFHQMITPNTHSLQWFLECCFGRIQLLLGYVPQFTIVGFICTDVRKYLLEQYPFLNVLGKVEDISHSLNQSRVMVIPTKFAAGIPQKVFDAACLGVPTVCSPIIGSQMSWTHDRECLIAPIDNGRLFAEQCVRLYSDALVWESVRDNALDSMRKYKGNHEPSNGILKVLADLKLDS